MCSKLDVITALEPSEASEWHAVQRELDAFQRGERERAESGID